jgi:hypothetical protein
MRSGAGHRLGQLVQLTAAGRDGRARGLPGRLIEDENELDPAWLVGAGTVGVTAGASAPNELVERVVAALASFGKVDVRERTVVDEAMHFSLPPELREDPEVECVGGDLPEDWR